MNKTTRSILFLILGVFIGSGLTVWLDFSPKNQPDNQTSTSSKGKTPRYWVAPMDANYRRDKPGKSPMGMDLVPVYNEETSAGTVKISPEVINNLGVRTALIERKPLVNNIKTVGYVGYNEETLIHIHPRTEGWIETLYIKSSGEKVNAGQALYSLYFTVL